MCLYRSSKICSGSGIPGNRTVFRGNNGSSNICNYYTSLQIAMDVLLVLNVWMPVFILKLNGSGYNPGNFE
jgi:hypothetical protein